MSTQQPEAIRLADCLSTESESESRAVKYSTAKKAALELRRLHAETTNQQDWLVEMTKGEHEIRRLRAENADLSDQCLKSVLAISALNDEIGRITEQRDEAQHLRAKNELLIELLRKAFPFVEDAASDEVYKAHRVHKILDDIRGAIAVHDAIGGEK